MHVPKPRALSFLIALFLAAASLAATVAGCCSPNEVLDSTDARDDRRGNNPPPTTNNNEEPVDPGTPYRPGLSHACASAGQGPTAQDRSSSEALFPLEPLLDLDAEATCSTLSPARLYALVDDPGPWLAGLYGWTGAQPGEIVALLEALDVAYDLLVRSMLGVGPDDDVDLAAASTLRVVLNREADPESFAQLLADRGWESEDDALLLSDQVLLELYGAWGEDLARLLELPEEVVRRQVDALAYPRLLGVRDREDGLAVLATYAITEPSLPAGGRLSILHATVPGPDGRRTAYVWVVDQELRPVDGLSAASFVIREGSADVDPATVEVTTLSALGEAHPGQLEVALSLVVDGAWDVGPGKASLTGRLVELLDALPPVYEATVVKFGDEAWMVEEMTPDRDTLAAALGRPSPEGRGALYDGMALGVESAAEAEEAPLRLTLVFTGDPEFASESACHASVAALSQQARVPVFLIGQGDINIPTMMSLTNATHGGLLYSPHLSDDAPDTAKLAEALGATLVISWPASGEGGGVVAIGVDRASGRLGDTFVPAGAP